MTDQMIFGMRVLNITQAGTAANAIPERALLDTYVRAASFDVMMDTNRKINRAIGASAAALGAHVEITDNPGNFPLHCDERMTKGVEKIIDDIFGAGQYIIDSWSTQSTDAGDISSLMPVIQHHCMGAVGTQHGADFYIQDKTKALVNPCAVLLCMIHDLLSNHAAYAEDVLSHYKPLFGSRQEYFACIERIRCHRELVTYEGDHQLSIEY